MPLANKTAHAERGCLANSHKSNRTHLEVGLIVIKAKSGSDCYNNIDLGECRNEEKNPSIFALLMQLRHGLLCTSANYFQELLSGLLEEEGKDLDCQPSVLE